MERKQEVMKNFLKGAAVAVVLIVLIVINIICNMNGHELDSVSTGTVASVCAMLLYGGLTKNEKNKDDQK
jgi:high-affinity Fe2+/Pb2+ permease